MSRPNDTAPQLSDDDLIRGDPSVELSSNRTSLSFERTRMSIDRTLMSVVRTCLSLISFGFTLHQVFSKSSGLFPQVNAGGGRVGLAMIVLGIVMLMAGVFSHAKFDRGLRARRQRLYELRLLRRAPHYHATPTYLLALALLVVGVFALAATSFRIMS